MSAKFLRIPLIVCLALGALVPTATIVLAETQESCPTTDTTRIRLWENAIGGTGDGNDSLWLCGNASNLSHIGHNVSTNCADGGIFGGTTWNDCVNSYTSFVPSGQFWCFFWDANYGVFLDHRGGSGTRYNLVYGDVLTSLYISGAPNPSCNI